MHLTALQSSLAALALLTPSAVVLAADNPPAGATLLEDAKLYFTAPLRWDARDWQWFAGTVAAIAVAHEFDDDVRDHFVDTTAPLDGHDSHGASDAAPAAALVAGLAVYSLVAKDAGSGAETWQMLEAAGLSAIAVSGFKLATGRERPNETADVDRWGKGGDAFPSMHATLAFAIGTVFAESGDDEHRALRRGVGYGVGAGTAYLRLKHNQHWLSDTVAGAALGIATANFVMNRRASEHPGRVAFAVEPLDGGMLINFSISL